MVAISLRSRSWIAAAAAIACGGGLAAALLQNAEPQVSAPVAPASPSLPAIKRKVRPVAEPAPVYVMIGELVSRGTAKPDCGVSQFDTAMVFADVDNAYAKVQVAVTCAELSRPSLSPSAGDAPVLREGTRYRLEVSGPISGKWGEVIEAPWHAERIDFVSAQERVRPAIADMQCRDVWDRSCSQR